MSEITKEIRAAINSFDMEHARELLREALKQHPSADIYYLASLAAINEQQKISFLEKAIELDPFHKDANIELQLNKYPTSKGQPSNQSEPKLEQINPSNQVHTNSLYTSGKFITSNAMVFTTLGFSIAGLLVNLDLIFGIPFITGSTKTWLDYFSYPAAGLVAGITVANILEQLIPSFKAKRMQIIWGWTVGWFLTQVISAPLFSGSGSFLYNFLEMMFVSFLMGVATNEYSKGMGLKIFFYWILAYVISIIFFTISPSINRTVYPSDVPIIVLRGVIGNWFVGIIGCYLTIIELRKSLSS